MKKIKFIVLFLLTITLSGCYNYKELNDLAITTAISIDYQDNNFKIIAEVINPVKQQDAMSSNSSPIVNYYSSAPSLQEAFRSIVLDSPRQLYTAQMQIIILSEEAAESHMTEILEFFSRDTEPRTELKFIIARTDESLKAITLQTLLNNLSSSNILESLEVQEKVLALSKVYTLNDLLNMYLNPYLEINLPSVILEGPASAGDEKENVTSSTPIATAKIDTIAVFKDNKLLGYLDNNESITYNLMLGAKDVLLNINCKDGYAIFETNDIKVKKEAKLKDNTVKLEVKGTARLKEINANINLKDPKEVKKLKKIVDKEIEDNITKVFNNIRKKYNSDIFGFRDLYYKTDPDYYKKNYDNNWYEEVFPNLKLDVKADIKLYEKGNTLGGLSYENKN